MLVALTTDQKLTLAGAAAVFIVFSLVVSLWIPRYKPDFPGKNGVGLFAVITLLLTVGMLGAMVVFAKEDEAESAAAHGGTGAETPAETNATGQTTPGEGEPGEGGNAEEGQAVYAENGCGGCHVYEPAGSNGQVGPNLDESLEGKDAEYIERAIVEPNADIAEGFSEGIMPAFDDLPEEDVANLVAFLTGP